MTAMGVLDTPSIPELGITSECDKSPDLQSDMQVNQTMDVIKSTLPQLHQLKGPYSQTNNQLEDLARGKESPLLNKQQSLARYSPEMLHKRSVTPTFMDEKARLKVKRVIGTTATSHASFCCIGNFVAYTSGAGAVIAQLQERSRISKTSNDTISELYVSAERFFCTSPKMLQHYHQMNWLSGNIALEGGGGSQQVTLRDENGFLQSGGITVKSMIDSIGVNSGNDYDSSGNNGAGSSSSSSGRRDRIKTTSCLSLSQDGKLLAVGETGYQPQVLVYSTAWNSSKGPLVMLSEHSFGVKLLAFSPCGRYLASLGTANDGFLHIWTLQGLRESGTAQLHSSNRCISVINDMKWSGSKLITAGRRHLRLWKISNYNKGVASGETSDGETNSTINDGKANVLSGRNLVLGDFSTSNFVSIVQISPGLLIVATEKGELATVEDPLDESASSNPKFIARLSVGFSVSAMDIDFHEHLLWVSGPTSKDMKAIPLQVLLSAGPMKSPASNPGRVKLASDHITALYTIRLRTMIRLSAKKEIQLVELKNGYSVDLLEKGNWQDAILYARRLKNSHEEGIKGIRVMPDLKGFMTWSGGGLLRIWNSDADCLSQFRIPLTAKEPGEDFNTDSVPSPSEDNPNNQLTAVASISNGKVLIAGDLLGMVRLIDPKTEKVIQLFYAHGSEIVDIAYCKTGESSDEREVFITSSRDRTVQIFSLNMDKDEKSWSLLQTLATHKSSVIKVLITQDAQRIVSCSSDRTIVIHKAAITENEKGERHIVAYVPEKVISLRSTPTDMFLDEDISNTLVVACNDKYIYVYKFPSGELASSYKSVDRKGDSLVLHDISIIRVPSLTGTTDSPRKRLKRVYLVGIGNDKSIRVYEHPSGVHVGCEWGHSEGVSGLELIKNTTSLEPDGGGNSEWVLASSGNDGCVFLWSLKGLDCDRNTWENSSSFGSSDDTVVRTSPSRKILSKAELARLVKSLEPIAPVSPSPAGNITTPSKQAKQSGPSTPISNIASPITPKPLTVTKQRSLRHSMSTLSLSQSTSSSSPLTDIPGANTDPRKRLAHRRTGSLSNTPITTPETTPSKLAPISSTEKAKITPRSSIPSPLRSSVGPQRRQLSGSKSLSAIAPLSKDQPPKTEEPKKLYGTLRRQRSSRTSLLAPIPSSSASKIDKSSSSNIYNTSSSKLPTSGLKKQTSSPAMSMKSPSQRTPSGINVKVPPPKIEGTTAVREATTQASNTASRSPNSLFSERSSSISPTTPDSFSSIAATKEGSNLPKGTMSINDLCTGLAQFREQYRQNKKSSSVLSRPKSKTADQESIEKLKHEMKQTLVLLEGSLRERVKVDELVELFGDRLVEMISSKIT